MSITVYFFLLKHWKRNVLCHEASLENICFSPTGVFRSFQKPWDLYFLSPLALRRTNQVENSYRNEKHVSFFGFAYVSIYMFPFS